MQKYFGVVTILLLVVMVLTRVAMLKMRGVKSMRFGETNKSDFLIPPFVLFYFYTVFAHAFSLWMPGGGSFFDLPIISWAGTFACTAGLVIMGWSLVSFGNSFRVGIDEDHPDKLITTGIFEVTRNPIYLAFGLVLLGQFLLLPNWVTLAFLVGGVLVVHRQVLREERFLRSHYGQAYEDYCGRVRRYL
jgi:protein-S-isoprenylcysteine O-methyltransferase Ste14